MEVEFLDHYKFSLETFVSILKTLIKTNRKLKDIKFINWNWNGRTFFSLRNYYNIKKIELINNMIYCEEFWSISDLNILNLKNCTIDYWVMKKVPNEFSNKLIMNYNENYSTILK